MTRAERRQSQSPLAGDQLFGTFARLVRLQTRLWNELDAKLRLQHSVALADLTVLELVASINDCRVQDIVDTQHITVGGASKVADRLVTAGHVERSANPNDRRSSILAVTPQGRDLLEHAKPEIDDVLATYFTGALPPGGHTELDRLLTAMQETPGPGKGTRT